MQYLTEERLKKLTSVIFNYEIKFNKKLGKFIPDIFIPKKNLIIEFDGPFHYTKTKTIIRDFKLDDFAKINKINVVHVPYFVQVDKTTFPLIFKTELTTDTKKYLSQYQYPHGFIDKKAVLPADYCSLGIDRFKKDLKYFSIVAQDILKSLDNLIISSCRNCLEVVPLKIVPLIDSLNNYLVISIRDGAAESYITKANYELHAILEEILDRDESDEEFIEDTLKILEKNKVEVNKGVYYTYYEEVKLYIVNLDQLKIGE